MVTGSLCQSVRTVDPLDNNAACRVRDSCAGIDCCVATEHVALLRRIKFHFAIDNCQWILSIGIENYHVEDVLYNFTFGEWDTFYLKGVFRIE